VPFAVLVVDGDELEEAQRKLAEAAERRRRAERNLDPDKPERVKEHDLAKQAVKRAEKTFESCWEKILLTAMPPDEFEDLKAEHPPTDEQLKKDPDLEYNKATFRPALLAACAEGGHSAEEWQDMLNQQFSDGERQELFTTALAINAGTRVVESVVLPKGSNGILNLLSNYR